MTTTVSDGDQRLTGVVFLGFGICLAAVTGWQLFATGAGGLVGLLVGIAPSFLLAIVHSLVGVWVLRNGPDSGDTRRLLGWTLASGLFGASSATLFVVYETNLGATIYDVGLVVTNTAAGFAVVGVVVGYYNIRARQRESELTRYKQLVENIPVGIFRTTPGPDGEFVEVNPAMVELTSADDEETLLERQVSTIYADPQDRRQFSEQLREEGQVNERVTRYRRLDGTPVWVSLTAIRFEDEGETYFDGIVEDITERKRYEETLERHNQQLEVLNDVLRHDIRNDMAVIRARGEQLRDAATAGETLDADHLDAIETLLSRVEQVVDLTETARDLADAISTDQTADLDAVGLSDVLDTEISAARETTENATITVDGDFPDVVVRADDMLSSVFRNLLTNAVQHNDSETPYVTVSVETSDEQAIVRIADNGPGIPDDQKERIFEYGEKGDHSGGTGLGLYLVAVLVDQYGGSVDVADRADDSGTVFTVRLSLAESESGRSWFD